MMSERRSKVKENPRKDKASKTARTISGKEFRRLIEVHGLIGEKTIEALHWHLVQGSSKSEAAWLAGINPSTVTRGLKRLVE
jgi:hypothetical protein